VYTYVEGGGGTEFTKAPLFAKQNVMLKVRLNVKEVGRTTLDTIQRNSLLVYCV
jgi:hypothetical protein